MDEHTDSDAPSRAQVDAVMLAARVLVGVTAQSFAAIEDRVTLPQLRVMVMIASRGPLNLGSIAEGLDVHPSNASRACDRLVAAGLLDRRDDPADRRNLLLQLTEAGAQLVDDVTAQRRKAIFDVLTQMPARRRRSLVPALTAFADAAGEAPEANAWALGWTTENPPRTPQRAVVNHQQHPAPYEENHSSVADAIGEASAAGEASAPDPATATKGPGRR